MAPWNLYQGIHRHETQSPTVQVRSGRFMQSCIRTLTGYAQNAHKTGILSLHHSRLTRSGLSSSIRPPIAPPCFACSALRDQPLS